MNEVNHWEQPIQNVIYKLRFHIFKFHQSQKLTTCSLIVSKNWKSNCETWIMRRNKTKKLCWKRNPLALPIVLQTLVVARGAAKAAYSQVFDRTNVLIRCVRLRALLSIHRIHIRTAKFHALLVLLNLDFFALFFVKTNGKIELVLRFRSLRHVFALNGFTVFLIGVIH